MKVYYQLDDNEYQNEKFEDIANSYLRFVLLYHKFRTMWELRSLESDIKEEGGVIIIEQGGRTHFKGFTQALIDKMVALLKD